jgi:hypothetical protein
MEALRSGVQSSSLPLPAFDLKKILVQFLHGFWTVPKNN